jgi:hypothetical protein
MQKKDIFTRILAIAGTIIAWFILLAPFVLAIASFLIERIIRFDFLLPAELFPVALVGGGLLLWASLRRHARRRLIGGSFAVAAGVLIIGQVVALVTGLASGETEPTGMWVTLGFISLILYWLALFGLGWGGILLLGDLSKSSISPADTP